VTTIARTLAENARDSLAAERVKEELLFTGVVTDLTGELSKGNVLFWEYISRYEQEEADNPRERVVWNLIEETEVGLRGHIVSKYEEEWGSNAFDRMKANLGQKEWDSILDLKKRSAGKYRYSPEHPERDEMSCMYLGQLVTLMIHGSAWHLFKQPYKDKRELQDRIAAISPVRNDRAHFSKVPPKELDRCRIACDDLSVILNSVAP